MSKPVDPRIRLAIASWPADGPRGAVTSLCAEVGISRNTSYKLRRLAEQMGLDAPSPAALARLFRAWGLAGAGSSKRP